MSIPKTLFTYWEGTQPPYIELCLESIRERSGVEVVILNQESAPKYAKGLNDNYRRITNIAQKVDCLRVAVLYHHGGMWCDADTILFRSVAHLFLGDITKVFRWPHNRKILNGYFLAPTKCEKLKKCLDVLNNELKAGRAYYDHGSGCRFGEVLFEECGFGSDGTEIPIKVLLPVNFPTDPEAWLKTTTIYEHMVTETVGVALNHSHVPQRIRSTPVDEMLKWHNLFGSVLRHYKFGGPASVEYLDSASDTCDFLRYVEASAPKRRAHSAQQTPKPTLPQKQPPKKPASPFASAGGRLLIAASCDAQYSPYLPIFLHSATRAWPDTDIAVITVGVDPTIPKNPRVHIVQIDEHCRGMSESGWNTAALRFLVCPELFLDYDFILFTDIDMLLFPEKIPLQDQHAHHMKKDGTLCYENWVMSWHDSIPRLLGIHFITRTWWERTASARAYELEQLRKAPANVAWYDEIMLGRIVKKSGLPYPPDAPKMWRHHGVHIGEWRIHKVHKSFKVNPSVFEKLHIRSLLDSEEFMAIAKESAKKMPFIGDVVRSWPSLFR